MHCPVIWSYWRVFTWTESEPSSSLGPYRGFKMKYGLSDCPDISETTQNSDILTVIKR